jgi:3'-phosphoadenosine 5'-phosphosulfate sulfotransferase (PAPS reductase)/FAD synthetase
MPIQIPKEILDLGSGVVFVCNVSGGKDSTATALALLEAGIPHRRVFADTAWEAPETYEHLDMLRAKLGPIDVVGYPGGMPAKIREGARFASRMQRWCTRELKIEPLRRYCDAIEADGSIAVTVTGIRHEEGTRTNGRGEALEAEDDVAWGGWMWRPIVRWTIADVLAIHHRHGVPVNPLYQRGHDRVGCYPCVMASKEDVRLVADHSPERIAEIRELEQHVTAERIRRNAEHRALVIAQGEYVEPFEIEVTVTALADTESVERLSQSIANERHADARELAKSILDTVAELAKESAPPWTFVVSGGYKPRYAYPDASFFLKAANRDTPGAPIMKIDEVVAWSRTERGGRQLPMFPPVPDGGCFRWGLCEAPAKR